MSTKYILVGGYIHKALDGGRAFCEELVRSIDKKPIKILDCMFARKIEDWKESIEKDAAFFSKFISDFKIELADPNTFTQQVKNSDIIYLRGGYTSRLIEALNKNNDWIKELNGKVLAGSSAGGEAIAKYYSIPKTQRVGDGVGLLPVKFIPHWMSDYADEEVSNIDWESELKKLKGYKEDLPVYTLHEGEFKVFEK